MLSSRMQRLLKASADQLREGIAPLSHGFLVEHEVTLDEAYALSDWLAMAIDALIELNRTPDGQKIAVMAMAKSFTNQTIDETKES